MFKRDDLVPRRMRHLPRDHRNYPVPFFVGYVDGKPDFRVIAAGRMAHCHNNKLCWLCGEKLGRFLAFVIGPMCTINRISAEPPAHRECAEFAVKACPFLTLPKAERRDVNLPEGTEFSTVMLPHNPGATALWMTESYKVIRDEEAGVMFKVGHPARVDWFAEGRPATRLEVVAAIAKGYPFLLEAARQEGISSVADLERLHLAAVQLFPPE